MGTEEHCLHFVSSDHADEFANHAVHENQQREQDLDGPKMRPDDLREQFMVGSNETGSLLPEVVKVLQIVDEQSHEKIDRRLPADVPDQRLFGKAVDERQHVGD